jgi:hypothetical protein
VDRRFRNFRVMPETEALDYANDVTALAREGHAHLVQLHGAHRHDGTYDMSRYIKAVGAVDGKFTAIDGAAHDWAGFVEESPVLTEGQLDLALCPEGLAGPGGHAA